jgi:hypothetical protein
LLWAQGKRREALAEFEQAYQLSPEFKVLYYIGAVSLELEQWARARRAFELYLELGAGHLDEEQVKEAREHLEETNQHTATLTLILNVPGVDVHVDGSKVESTTTSGLVLETGEHLVRVSKPGFRPLEKVVRATHGENVHLVLPLTPLAPPPAVEAASATAGDGSAREVSRERGLAGVAAESSPTPLWIPWTITGALATGWLTTAVLAVQARHDRDLIEHPATSAARIDSARRLHLTLAVVSDVLLASTLASAGVSAYLTWWPPAAPGATGAPAASAARRALLLDSPGMLLNVSGSF